LLHHEGLNRIERCYQPLRRSCSRTSFLRHRRRASLAYVQHNGSGLEEHEPVLFEDGNLPEGLQSTVLRLVLISLLEEAHAAPWVRWREADTRVRRRGFPGFLISATQRSTEAIRTPRLRHVQHPICIHFRR
jgi:hypothetical protein